MSNYYHQYQQQSNSHNITPTSSPQTQTLPQSYTLALSADDDEENYSKSEAYYSDAKTATDIHDIMAEQSSSDESSNINGNDITNGNTSPPSPIENQIDTDYSYYLDEDNGQQQQDTQNSNEEEEIFEDATTRVHESYYALLYLLSNNDEFHEVLNQNDGLKEWNEHESSLSATDIPTPLPFAVFAPDAEVVLPQAHTASQLFGVETIRGIELEAAAGVLALSQLFLRWLALMPAGDHCNIIDPPGLTVMRIAGGRYRVTGAHRVVWTWMNEFAPEAVPSYYSSPYDKDSHDLRFSFGDLVTMTIIDVFETDKDGKLLSYCPTFDNRSITKTNVTRERLSKKSHEMKEILSAVGKSRAAYQVNKAACYLGQVGLNVARGVGGKVYEAWNKDGSIIEKSSSKSDECAPSSPSRDVQDTIEEETNNFVINDAYPDNESEKILEQQSPPRRSEHYVSDDETTNSTR